METPNDRTPSPPPPYESEENAPVAHCAAAASEAPPGSRVASLTAAPVQLPAPRFREAPAPAPVPGASSATTAVMLDVVLGNTADASGERYHASVNELRPSFAWEFYASFGSAEAAALVDTVTVRLHPTFKTQVYTLRVPAGSAEVRTPQIQGWGVFEIEVEVRWRHDRVVSPAATHLVWMLQGGAADASEHSQVMVKTPATSGSPSPPLPPQLPAQQQQQQDKQQQQRQKMQQLVNHVGRRGHRGRAIKRQAVEVTGAADKPKDANHTVVAMVIDRSGSMRSMGDEVSGGCNAYLDEQRKTDVEDGARSTVIFTRFDSYVETLHEKAPLDTMAAITAADVEPRGSTALYDAIGESLVKTAALVNGLDATPSVCVFILTDGKENASQAWDKAAVAKEISKLQSAHSWDFYFAAANQDAMKEGAALGMDSEQCVNFKMKQGKMAYVMQQTNVAYQRKMKGYGKGYTRAERREAEE